MMWDEVYSVEEYVYGKEPNDFLRQMTARLKPGRVLCLGEGEGRNAVHLAKLGFSVTAVDSSWVGLDKAESLASAAGVALETIHADLAGFRIEPAGWDSIVSIFCHVPSRLRRELHRKVVAGLAPGGTFLLEAYTPAQLELGTGGPPAAEFMMDLVSLRRELAGLAFELGRELIREVLEGTKHTGRGSVVQVLARQPAGLSGDPASGPSQEP